MQDLGNYTSLHFKRVHSNQAIYSARITKNFRAIGVINDGIIIWFWIGSHDDYDRILKKL